MDFESLSVLEKTLNRLQLTYTSADLYVRRPICPQTYTSADLYVRRAMRLQTYTLSDTSKASTKSEHLFSGNSH